MKTGSTPNDMLPAMNQVGCILFTPLIQHVIYPFLHKRRIYIRPIMRIAIGFIFVALSMVYASLVQHTIYSTAPCYNHPRACSAVTNHEPNHVNVWVQAPVFFLIAMGEVWAYVTALEIAYSHAPKHMKSVIQACFPLMAAIGSACAMGITPFAHDPNLVILCASLAGGMAIVTVAFWFFFRKYDKDEKIPSTQDCEEAEQSPYSEAVSPEDAISEIDLCPGFVDVELAQFPSKLASNGTITPKRAGLTGTALLSHDVDSARTNNKTLTGQCGAPSTPQIMQLDAVDQTIVPKSPSTVQLLPSPLATRFKQPRKLQKRQSRSLITSAASTAALRLSSNTPYVTLQQNLLHTSLQEECKFHAM